LQKRIEEANKTVVEKASFAARHRDDPQAATALKEAQAAHAKAVAALDQARSAGAARRAKKPPPHQS